MSIKVSIAKTLAKIGGPFSKLGSGSGKSFAGIIFSKIAGIDAISELSDDLVMKYMDGSQFKVQLVDGQGKAYAGQTVTFNINGVFYRSVTDNTGQAKLNINLMPGAYIITSSYNGFNISNTIKISA